MTNKKEPTYEEIFYRVKKFMGWTDERVKLWFVTPHPMLFDNTPLELIETKKIKRLAKFIDLIIGY